MRTKPGIEIRAETSRDFAAIRALNLSAFDSPLEADLVAALRAQAVPFISLVALDDDDVAGHIAFSPAALSGHPAVSVMGLAPMAVKPELQRRGIGAALVGAGLAQCRELACDAVVVLGHADYYPRFGFVPASRFGIDSHYDTPDDTFMLLQLNPGALAGKSGRIRYHPAFDRF